MTKQGLNKTNFYNKLKNKQTSEIRKMQNAGDIFIFCGVLI